MNLSPFKAIPGFPWEKIDGVEGREQIEGAAEEENAGAVIGKGEEAAGGGFELLDFAVEAFGDGVGDAMGEKGGR